MKKELLLLLSMLLPFTAWAELKYIGVGDLSYTINTETHNASVRGSSKTDLISVTIPSSIVYDDVTYQVVGIEDYAFLGRSALTSVSFPSSLRVIGQDAFDGCGITQVLIPGSVQTVGNFAFANCSNLMSFSLGGSMTLGMGAFKSCVSLSSVSIPEGSTLYQGVFSYCTGLTSVTIPKNITFVDGGCFSQCTGLTSVRIENTTTGTNTFEGCSSLTTVTFGPDARTIDKSCFYNCTGLTSFVVPNQIATINDGAFYNCTNLESLTLGNGLVSVGNSYGGLSIVVGCEKLSKVIIPDIASWCNVDFVTHGGSDSNKDMFYYAKLYSDENTEITHLVIPEGVSTIKKNVFMGCKNIESVSFANSVKSIEAYTFNDCRNLTMLKLGSGLKSIAAEGCFEGCEKLSKVVISDLAAYCNLTKGGRIFGAKEMHLYSDEDTEVKELVIPQGVTSIGEYLFYNFTSLTSLTLPNSLESIGTYAFYNCKGLKTILVGKGLKSVATYSFFYYGDYSKADFYILAAIPPEAVYDAFTISFSNKHLHVPASSLEQYKAATAWKNFTSITALQEGDPGYDELMGAVTLKAKSYSRVYGEANPTFEYEVTSGTIASGTPTITCSATATSPVGTYDIVIEKGTVDNSKVNLVNGTLTITKAPLTISAGDYNKAEGEENPEFSPTYSGFKNGETKGVLIKQPIVTTTATASSPVGTYTVTVSGAEATNYDIAYQNGTLTVISVQDALEAYKTQMLGKADACALLISEAKTAISNLSYNELKTLRENKDAVDALAGKLVHDIAELLGMVGDTNGDSKITIADAVGVVNIILNK